MPKSLKVVLFIIGGLAMLCLLVVAGLLLFLDINAYKPRLEAAASEVLGMEVRIDGGLGIALFPGLRVTLEDVSIRNRDDFATAKEVRIGTALLPLLRREVRIRKVSLESPVVSIERDTRAGLDPAKLKGPQTLLPALDGAKLSFSGGSFSYANTRTGTSFEAVDCSLTLDGLGSGNGEGPDLLKRLPIAAEATCGEVRANDFAVTNLKFSLAGKDGVFDLMPVTGSIFGAPGSGNLRADFSGSVPRYDLHGSLPQFRLEEFLMALSEKAAAAGPMDFTADLTLRGRTAAEMKESAEGNLSLRGVNLKIEGRDLDAEFSRYESSQNFNLVDVGAFFLAGPVGLAFTKGYGFTSIFLFQGSGGSSTVRTLVSDWEVVNGVVRAQDVALATKENRIALQGGLDFVNERFDNIVLALIDAKGCAKVGQKIHGTFQKPVVEKPNILTSLAGPALGLLKKGKELLPDGECEPFYSGSVAHPDEKKPVSSFILPLPSPGKPSRAG